MLFTRDASTPQSALSTPAGPERIANYSLENVDEIFLDLPVGEANITGRDSDQLQVEMIIACDTSKAACTKLGNKVTLTKSNSSGTLIVAPSVLSKYAYRNSKVNYKIQVPHGMPLIIKFGFGELLVQDVQSDLEITMSAGEATVETKRSTVRNIWLDANVGDATLIEGASQEGDRRLVVGAEVDWREGRGANDISVDLGAGEITVKLIE